MFSFSFLTVGGYVGGAGRGAAAAAAVWRPLRGAVPPPLSPPGNGAARRRGRRLVGSRRLGHERDKQRKAVRRRSTHCGAVGPLAVTGAGATRSVAEASAVKAWLRRLALPPPPLSDGACSGAAAPPSFAAAPSPRRAAGFVERRASLRSRHVAAGRGEERQIHPSRPRLCCDVRRA